MTPIPLNGNHIKMKTQKGPYCIGFYVLVSPEIIQLTQPRDHAWGMSPTASIEV